MWHKQSFTQFWSQSDAYSRRSSLKLTYIHHPLVVCTHQICCAVAVPIALSQDRLLHGHNRLVNWTPCSRMRESKLKRCDRRTDGQTDRQTDGRTDRRTENTICRAAWTQLKTIGHLFYATLIFMYHFIAICEFKLEIQSGNAQFGLKSTIFFSRVTLTFDRWPWKSLGYRS